MVGLRSHSVVADQIVCHHSHVVYLTTHQAIQEAAGVGGVTGDCQALVSHSLDRVKPGTSPSPPHHLGSAHIVMDREIHGGTRLWRDKVVALHV